jgi:tRNA(fMet)-specific endonuclease VapC
VLPIDTEAAVRAAQVRADLVAKGEMIGSCDLLITGHALTVGATLVTNNTRKLGPIVGLEIESWAAD